MRYATGTGVKDRKYRYRARWSRAGRGTVLSSTFKGTFIGRMSHRVVIVYDIRITLQS